MLVQVLFPGHAVPCAHSLISAKATQHGTRRNTLARVLRVLWAPGGHGGLSSPEQCRPSPVRPAGQGPHPACKSQLTPGKHPWAQGSAGSWQKRPEEPPSHLQAASWEGDSDTSC